MKTESDNHSSILKTKASEVDEEKEKLKEKEFKRDILSFGVDDENIKDPDLIELKDKMDGFKVRDEQILDKVKKLEKLSEDLNLLTNYLRNGIIDASKIESLHKPQRKKEFNIVEINNNISESCYECKISYYFNF